MTQAGVQAQMRVLVQGMDLPLRSRPKKLCLVENIEDARRRRDAEDARHLHLDQLRVLLFHLKYVVPTCLNLKSGPVSKREEKRNATS